MTIRSYLFRLVAYPLIALFLFLLALFNLPSLAFLTEYPHPLLLTLFLAISAALVFALIRATFLTEKIRAPIQQLQDSALSVAAGEYKEPLHVEGPQELVDLGNAINTMSECLQETVSRLRESAVLRERMYGEYECSLLLQYYMLEHVLDSYRNPRLHVKALSYTTAATLHGVLLELKDHPNGQIDISFYEAKERGFLGIYHLLTHPEMREERSLKLSLQTNGMIYCVSKELLKPILWSASEGKEILLSENARIQSQDLLIVYNTGLVKCFEENSQLATWFHKVLRHFGSEGFDLCLTMLQHELNFLTRRQQIHHDIHLLCIQLK